jgi:hypothetical protein
LKTLIKFLRNTGFRSLCGILLISAQKTRHLHIVEMHNKHCYSPSCRVVDSFR